MEHATPQPHRLDRDDPASVLLTDLTDAQREAVSQTEGPVLVLAAAGSGKTRVITRRVASLLHAGVPAWSILALTFTNKAAGEMRERVRELIAGHPSAERLSRGLTMGTFHSVCARLLRRFAPLMSGRPDWGIDGDFTIYDTDDQISLMKRTIKALGYDTSNWSPRSVLNAISGAKNELKGPREYEHEAADFYERTTSQIYTAYTRAMRDANALDFDDLLMLTVRLLRECPDAKKEVQDRWRYLMIDEYQDTNHAQFVLSTLLVGHDEGEAPNVCVVGDPDQSIYGWRGADISNILDFESQYPGCRVIALGENFRSSAPILACADALIQHNERRKHKPLFTSRDGGTPPEVTLCYDEQHEAQHVVDWFRSLAGGGEEGPDPQAGRYDLSWKDMAVMYRNNALSRVVEDALRRSGIPYVVARGTAFYQREEVRDAIAYLRVVANPADDVSLRRIVNRPARKIGKTTIAKLDELAARERISLFEALRRANEADITPAATNACTKFVEMIDAWTGGGTFMGAAVPTALPDLVERVLRESGLEKHYKALAAKSQSEAEEAKVENLAEVISSATQFEEEYDAADDPAWDPFDFLDTSAEGSGAGSAGSGESNAPPLLAMLRAYLESVALVADADRVDPASGAVTLMTLHAAKGLEFGAVAIVGLEEGTLPGVRALESDEQLEEERRLCFVGITRAMHRLQITSVKYRTHRGVSERCLPSRFLDELPEEHVVTQDIADIAHGLGTDWGERRSRKGHDPDDADGFGARTPDDGFAEPIYDDEIDQRPASERFAETKPRSRKGGKRGFRGPRLRSGQLVRHPQFGVGRVETVDLGLNARARIAFEDTGTKTLILQYARLEILGE